MFIAAQVVHGVGGSCFSTASVAFISEGLEADRGRLMGLLFSGVAWGSIIGTASGGIVYEKFGQKTVFISISVLMFFLLLTIAFVLPREHLPVSETRRVSRIFRLMKHPEIAKALLLILLSNFSLGAYLVLMPGLLAERPFDWSSAAIGYAMVGGPVVYISVSYSIDRLIFRFGNRILARCSVLLISAGFLVMMFPVVRENAVAVVVLFTEIYGITSLVQIPQPGVIAAVLDQSASTELPQTAGAALVDVAIGCGYASMALTAWVRSVGEYRGVFAYAVVIQCLGVLCTLKPRGYAGAVRMISEQ
jgi:predicted MFS family arabinose efflux permease